jgi:uncharacterized protein RhaS with RHS repeats
MKLRAPRIITDDTGSVVWRAEYLPFGKVNILTEQIENNLRFPGQYFDAETGLHYNWNRYYSGPHCQDHFLQKIRIFLSV